MKLQAKSIFLSFKPKLGMNRIPMVVSEEEFGCPECHPSYDKGVPSAQVYVVGDTFSRLVKYER